ncbi:MAG TPA: M23 family metallopeptidase [Nitrospiria bacterium]
MTLRLFLTVVSLLLAVTAPVSSKPLSDKPPSAPIRIKQGEAILFKVRFDPGAVSVNGHFRGRSIPFFTTGEPGEFSALIGADLADPPSNEEFNEKATGPNGLSQKQHFTVQLLQTEFATQKLTVPDKFVELDEETLQRVQKDQEVILGAMSRVTPERMWEGAFLKPTEGEVRGSFGLRRIMNGQPRSPHSGEDISAPLGAEVKAMNGGVVVLVGEFFFSGKSVIMDHGLGFYSMYFHLNDVDVKEGQPLQRGDRIGHVGATGRATGPHLHWGARLNGARINPLSLLALP